MYQDKHTLGGQFFDTVGGNAYKSKSERVIIVDDLITELRDKHNGWDNFHHEAPVASQLYSYNPDQISILENLAQRLFKTVLMCRIGNGVSYNSGVSPSGKPYYDAMLSMAGDKFAAHVMASLSDFEIRNRLSNPICSQNARVALQIVRANVINQRLLECLDFLIERIEKDPGCVANTDFKKLSAGYINWP